MGYFNFYLLRKLIRNLFNNKHFKNFLFFIAIFLFFLFIWNNVVLGYTFEYNNQTYTVPDPAYQYDYYCYVIVKNRNLSYFEINYFTCTQPIRYYYNISGSSFIGLYNAPSNYNSYSCHTTSYGQELNSWKSTNKVDNTNNQRTNGWGLTSTYNITFLEANQPVYQYNSTAYNSSPTNELYTPPVPPEDYDILPYFLNSDEDIAIGNQDLIIMPRRFS